MRVAKFSSLFLVSSLLAGGCSAEVPADKDAMGDGEAEKASDADMNCNGTYPEFYDARQKAEYQRRINAFDRLPARSGSIVIAGDSIIQRFDRTLLGENVLNLGVGGEETRGLLNRFDQIVALSPAQVFVLIGTNDIGRQRDLNDIKADFRLLLARAGSMPETDFVFLSILPRQAQFDEDVDRMNAFIRETEKPENVSYLDVYSAMTQSGDSLDEVYSYDGLHLTREGYDVLAAIIKPRMIDISEAEVQTERQAGRPTIGETVDAMCAEQ